MRSTYSILSIYLGPSNWKVFPLGTKKRQLDDEKTSSCLFLFLLLLLLLLLILTELSFSQYLCVCVCARALSASVIVQNDKQNAISFFPSSQFSGTIPIRSAPASNSFFIFKQHLPISQFCAQRGSQKMSVATKKCCCHFDIFLGVQAIAIAGVLFTGLYVALSIVGKQTFLILR